MLYGGSRLEDVVGKTLKFAEAYGRRFCLALRLVHYQKGLGMSKSFSDESDVLYE